MQKTQVEKGKEVAKGSLGDGVISPPSGDFFRSVDRDSDVNTLDLMSPDVDSMELGITTQAKGKGVAGPSSPKPRSDDKKDKAVRKLRGRINAIIKHELIKDLGVEYLNTKALRTTIDKLTEIESLWRDIRIARGEEDPADRYSSIAHGVSPRSSHSTGTSVSSRKCSTCGGSSVYSRPDLTGYPDTDGEYLFGDPAIKAAMDVWEFKFGRKSSDPLEEPLSPCTRPTIPSKASSPTASSTEVPQRSEGFAVDFFSIATDHMRLGPRALAIPNSPLIRIPWEWIRLIKVRIAAAFAPMVSFTSNRVTKRSKRNVQLPKLTTANLSGAGDFTPLIDREEPWVSAPTDGGDHDPESPARSISWWLDTLDLQPNDALSRAPTVSQDSPPPLPPRVEPPAGKEPVLFHLALARSMKDHYDSNPAATRQFRAVMGDWGFSDRYVQPVPLNHPGRMRSSDFREFVNRHRRAGIAIDGLCA